LATREHRVNRQIRIPEVQVIDQDGKQLGVMKTFDALRLAREHDLDLVEVGANTRPPITKIMDYGKYQYQKSKEAKARPKVKERKTKAVRVGFKTSEHDQEFIAKKADEFLSQGHWVRVELTLRGREKAVAERGLEQLRKFLDRLATPFTMQGKPARGHYGWVLIIQPDKKAAPKPEQDSNAETA
jgi:translation initiation factor IF-3